MGLRILEWEIPADHHLSTHKEPMKVVHLLKCLRSRVGRHRIAALLSVLLQRHVHALTPTMGTTCVSLGTFNCFIRHPHIFFSIIVQHAALSHVHVHVNDNISFYSINLFTSTSAHLSRVSLSLAFIKPCVAILQRLQHVWPGSVCVGALTTLAVIKPRL